ncbi:MAG: 23S rRNA (guanosine(2251)-2'-O)-methyltransferase RlmB [Holosporaceae bacterium]|nr:23S rRNA (guanosine(2251)-2'-O)-methyltransferase RlmB [Holosporaceae bacterium]
MKKKRRCYSEPYLLRRPNGWVVMGRKNNADRSSMWIYGKHAVKAALRNPQRSILRFILMESSKDFSNEPGKLSLKPEIVDRNFFSAIFGRDAIHQGCAVQVKKFPDYSIDELTTDKSDDRPFIFLDQVGDPQNIGSILRASAVFGVRAVVVTENNSPELTPAIVKAASGAAESVPIIRVVNLVHAINNLKNDGFWCVGLDERADKKIYETPLKGKIILVVGSEGEGLRRLTRETCDFLVQLPCMEEFSTLNAAQAATVSLYEMLRQRRSE